MKIQATDAFPDNGTLRVTFNSPYGSGTALWIGPPLKIGEMLDVELELDELFSWGQNIKLSSSKTPEITSVDGNHKMIGELIQSADHCYARLKLGDSVIVIELDKPVIREFSLLKWYQLRFFFTQQISEHYVTNEFGMAAYFFNSDVGTYPGVLTKHPPPD